MAENTGRWLSRDATELAHRLASDTDEAADCDVLIVGSGYGGAVAAARMAGCALEGTDRPARVWVLERGLEYLPGRFPRRFSELPGHVRFSHQDDRPARGRAEGLLDWRLGDQVHVLLANGLGGGSLINAGVMAQPDDAVFAQGWPHGITAASMAPWYDRALADLQPEVGPGDAPPKFAALQALAQARSSEAVRASVTIAFSDQAARPDVPALRACTACGDCMTGCNVGAKRSLDTSHLAQAWRRGAELFCGVTVTRLEPPVCEGAPWQVVWQFTDPALRDGATEAWVVRARQVVLAAGTLGSTELLLRSRSERFQLSPQLGTRFSTNGDMLAAVHRQRPGVNAVADQETDPGRRGRNVGPTITGLVRTEHDGLPIVVEEFAVPGALRQVFGEALATFGFSNINAGQADGFAVSADLLSSSSLYGLMGDDGAAGQLVLPAAVAGDPAGTGDGRLRVRWPDPGAGRVPVFDAQIAWLAQALSGKVPVEEPRIVPNPLWKTVLDRVVWPGSAPAATSGGIVTVHPLGGCPMADEVAAGVVDGFGRVFDASGPAGAVHPGLAVLDGSIVPRALAINPALTITALAERAVEALRDAWGLRPPAGRRRTLPPRGHWVDQHTPPRHPTAVRLSERMVGPLTIAGQPFWAALQLDDVELPDLDRLAAGDDRRWPAASASLSLWDNAHGGDEFSDWRPRDRRWQFRLAATIGLFLPVEGQEEDSRQLDYQFQVLSVGPAPAEGEAAPPMQVGARLRGLKWLGDGLRVDAGAGGGTRALRGLWRQLTELQLGPGPAEAGPRYGMLRVDYDHLAEHRSPLLAVQRQSSAPDQLGDLAGLALLVLRQALKMGITALEPPKDYGDAQIRHNLASRWPGTVDGVAPDVLRIGAHGARLSHYAPHTPAADRRPVLMVHGYGASGTTFTHPAIPVPLAAHLLRAGRHVWVLDLRSSIAHEADDPDAPRPGPWPFDEIATEDIPDALRCVTARSNGSQVDVVAHCIGAAMFSVAMLTHPQAHRWVGRAALSQTGPRMRFSPLNRLRGQLAAYLQQFMGLEELDNRPEYRRRRLPDGTVGWVRDEATASRLRMLDALLASYPYPDDDEDTLVEASKVNFKLVRRRADIIFGHLMELKNLAPQTLGCFDALNGWVKVRSFAQTIHYVNQGRLTDRSGNGRVLTHERLRERMGFPILLFHGRRNRVFDWRGSLASLRLLQQVRGITPDQGSDVDGGQATVWGDDALRLVRLNGYGHQDSLVGQNAAHDVFRHVQAFLDGPAASARPDAAAPDRLDAIDFGAPWLGPVWSDLQHTGAEQRWELRLLAHPAPQRARTAGWVLVPVVIQDGANSVQWAQARCIFPGDDVPWPPDPQADQATMAPPSLRDDLTALMTQRALRLSLAHGIDRFLVLIAYSDVPPEQLLQAPTDTLPGLMEELAPGGGPQLFAAHLSAVERPWLAAASAEPPWLLPGRSLKAQYRIQLEEWGTRWLEDAGNGRTAVVHLSEGARAAATGPAQQTPAPLCLALASCQYPPGLLDEDRAQASLAALDRRLGDADPPQLLLSVGDQVYLDATAGVFDAAAHAALPDARARQAYALNWRMPAFRAVASRLPVYTLMDDHEVHDGWQPRPRRPASADESAALRAHWRYQGSLNPAPWVPDSPHYSFRPAGALVVMLDTRRQRAPRRLGSMVAGIDLDGAQIVRPASMRQALELLDTAPPEVAKFFVSPAPLLPLRRPRPSHAAERLRADGWDGYPASMLQVLQFVAQHRIQRLVFLSGDAHLSAVCRLRLDDTLTVHAVMSSGLYAPWPFANGDPGDYLLDGRTVLRHGRRAVGVAVEDSRWMVGDGFATVSVSGPSGDPHALLTVDLVPGASGAPLRYTHGLGQPGTPIPAPDAV